MVGTKPTSATTTTVELAELDRDVPVRLAAAQGRRLAVSTVVVARPSPYDADVWLVSAAGKVGAARVGDVEVRIRPKLPIERLMFLVGYASDPKGWRRETVPLPETPDLVPALAQALWRQAERALRQGLLQGYSSIDESSPVLRGRLRETDQMYRWHGLALPLEIRYDEFTTDIAENQILRTAIDRMLRVPRVDDASRRMLRHLQRKLGEVTPLVPGVPLPPWPPTRLNARYHTALRIAEVVLRATSPDQGEGDLAVNGFLFDMPRVFEDFVTVALREEFEATRGGRVEAQGRSHLDEAGSVVMRPDMVWSLAGRPVAVIDAKYKAEKPYGHPHADLYQMLAYCTVLGLRRGHLVYARGNEEPARHVVRRAGVELRCHALDLETSPGSLLAQVAGLAAEIDESR
jgi:5-methylcytosine-specific restriction enzyme subunit McrC